MQTKHIKAGDSAYASQKPPSLGRIEGAILAHRRAFDRWMAAVDVTDAAMGTAKHKGACEARDFASTELDGSLGALLNTRPQTLYEASLSAAHLIPHVTLEHFPAAELIDFLIALSIAPSTDHARATAAVTSGPSVDSVDAIDNALFDARTLILTLREAIGGDDAAPPVSARNLYGSLGIVFDFIRKAEDAFEALHQNSVEA